MRSLKLINFDWWLEDYDPNFELTLDERDCLFKGWEAVIAGDVFEELLLSYLNYALLENLANRGVFI